MWVVGESIVLCGVGVSTVAFMEYLCAGSVYLSVKKVTNASLDPYLITMLFVICMARLHWCRSCGGHVDSDMEVEIDNRGDDWGWRAALIEQNRAAANYVPVNG